MKEDPFASTSSTPPALEPEYQVIDLSHEDEPAVSVPETTSQLSNDFSEPGQEISEPPPDLGSPRGFERSAVNSDPETIPSKQTSYSTTDALLAAYKVGYSTAMKSFRNLKKKPEVSTSSTVLIAPKLIKKTILLPVGNLHHAPGEETRIVAETSAPLIMTSKSSSHVHDKDTLKNSRSTLERNRNIKVTQNKLERLKCAYLFSLFKSKIARFRNMRTRFHNRAAVHMQTH